VTFRSQLDRNLLAMARELARDPGADQREWCAMAGEVFGFEVTQIVSSPVSGDANCHRLPSVESTGDENCQLEVTKIVTHGNDATKNRSLS
jgi:hypothetical protein